MGRVQLPTALGAVGMRTVPAVASRAVAEVIVGPTRTGTVLGVSRHAAWCVFGDDVLVLGDRDAVQLPNTVATAVLPPGLRAPRWGIPGSQITAGDGFVAGPGWRLGVVRWWEPHPQLAPCVPGQIVVALRSLGRIGVTTAGIQLGGALLVGDGPALERAARRIIGHGPGLTPVCDDLLAAVMAAFRLIGVATQHPTAVAFVESAGPGIVEHAKGATTALAVSLLRHAIQGDVAEPLGAFLRAISLGEGVHENAARLRSVGHSSGPALLEGAALGAVAACGGRP